LRQSSSQQQCGVATKAAEGAWETQMTVMEHPTVYFVDDDEAVRDSFELLAETAGLHAEAFESAVEFLSAFDPDRPGCLVVDLRMPVMSGLELQRTLNESGAELPVIVLSGHADVASAVSAMKAGAVEFLQKPFDNAELLLKISAAINRDTQLREQRHERQEIADRAETLTPRECEVMEGLVQGLSGKQIAARLGISYRTMEKFRANVMKKMETDSLAKLTRAAISADLFSDS
jgi:FixJ family two-component response regulator